MERNNLVMCYLLIIKFKGNFGYAKAHPSKESGIEFIINSLSHPVAI